MARAHAKAARLGSLLALACAAAVAVSGCGGSGASPASGASGASASVSPGVESHRSAAHHPSAPAVPVLLRSARGGVGPSFTPVVQIGAHTAVYIARLPSGLTALSFDQRLVRLALHSGSIDPGGSGWRYGPAVLAPELGRLVSAFNGGFKFDVGAGGFESGGRVGAPLRAGLASIVTYANGQTDIGTWNTEVPQAGRTVESVRQNLAPLIDHGVPASNLDCVSCWGATLGGVDEIARSALGVTADGHLIWAGGEHLTVAALADALLQARVARAVELDINPEWVAAYLYAHRPAGAAPGVIPVVPGQAGAPGSFLAPYGRDFFTMLAR
jgi:hypothetical protein